MEIWKRIRHVAWDNQPQRARSSSLSSKAKRGDSASDNSEGRRETHFVARL